MKKSVKIIQEKINEIGINEIGINFNFDDKILKIHTKNVDKLEHRFIFELYINDVLYLTSKLFARPDSFCYYDCLYYINRYIIENKDKNDVYFSNFYLKIYEEYIVNKKLIKEFLNILQIRN